jgi:integrase
VRVEPGIYKRPRDGKYEITTRDAGGVKRWVTVDGGIKAARERLAIEKAKSAKGELVPAAPRLTFGAAADLWWEAHSVRIRPSTRDSHRSSLRSVLGEFSSTRLTAITPAVVAQYVARMRAAGLKGTTIKGRLSIISMVYKYADRHLGHLGATPVSRLERGERPVSDITPPRVLTDEELAALLEAIDPRHRLLFELLAETGMRSGEGRALIWSNVDFDALELTIEATLPTWGDERAAPKTENSLRTIALTPTMVGKLRKHYLAMGRPFGGEFVFLRPRTSRARFRSYNRDAVEEIMRDARGRVGLDPIMRGRDVIARAPVPHDLRHTHASKLIATGFDMAEIATRLGDTIETVTRTYAHQWDAARRRKDHSARLEAALYGTAMEPTDSAKGPFRTGTAE